MAITVPSNHLCSPVCCSPSTSSRSSIKRCPLSLVAVLKQTQQTKSRGDVFVKPRPSPLLTAEEAASQFSLDMTVAELELLFRRAGFPGGNPPVEHGGSREHRPLRVVYQGGRGSYCQEAAVAAFPSLTLDSFPCTNMEDAFLALEDESADRAIVPAENSVDGPIDRNLDLLIRHQDIKIVGELILPVNHCLLSLPKAQVTLLRRVVSHPQALDHCKGRLEQLDLEVNKVGSAAEAARLVAENRIVDTAVIGSKMAAKEFGLEILEENFQDPAVNFNRFLHLGLGAGTNSTTQPGGNRKTTVAFSLLNGVSGLFRAMRVFETQGVRVRRVEHRPNQANPIRVADKESGKAMYLDYVFILDLEGNGSDPKVKTALADLAQIAGFSRVLGSYTSKCA